MWTEIPQWEFFLSRPLLDLSGKIFLGLAIWTISRVLEGQRGPAGPWKWQSLVQVESKYGVRPLRGRLLLWYSRHLVRSVSHSF